MTLYKSDSSNEGEKANVTWDGLFIGRRITLN